MSSFEAVLQKTASFPYLFAGLDAFDQRGDLAFASRCGKGKLIVGVRVIPFRIQIGVRLAVQSHKLVADGDGCADRRRQGAGSHCRIRQTLRRQALPASFRLSARLSRSFPFTYTNRMCEMLQPIHKNIAAPACANAAILCTAAYCRFIFLHRTVRSACRAFSVYRFSPCTECRDGRRQGG